MATYKENIDELLKIRIELANDYQHSSNIGEFKKADYYEREIIRIDNLLKAEAGFSEIKSRAKANYEFDLDCLENRMKDQITFETELLSNKFVIIWIVLIALTIFTLFKPTFE